MEQIKTIPVKQLKRIQENIDLLLATELVKYHNKNFLPTNFVKNPGELSKERQKRLMEIKNIVDLKLAK